MAIGRNFLGIRSVLQFNRIRLKYFNRIRSGFAIQNKNSNGFGSGFEIYLLKSEPVCIIIIVLMGPLRHEYLPSFPLRPPQASTGLWRLLTPEDGRNQGKTGGKQSLRSLPPDSDSRGQKKTEEYIVPRNSESFLLHR